MVALLKGRHVTTGRNSGCGYVPVDKKKSFKLSRAECELRESRVQVNGDKIKVQGYEPRNLYTGRRFATSTRTSSMSYGKNRSRHQNEKEKMNTRKNSIQGSYREEKVRIKKLKKNERTFGLDNLFYL